MKEKIIEDKLNLALDSLNHIEISNKAVNKIDEMLQKLPPKNKVKSQRRKRLKNSLVAAGITIGLLGGFCVTFPTYASSIPILNKIVGEDSIFGWDFGKGSQSFSDDLKDYSVYIGETREDNGLKITIEEMLFDGQEMYLAYSVEGEVIKELDDLFENEEKYPMPVGFEFTINGESPQGFGWTMENKKEKEDKFIIRTSINLNNNIEDIDDLYDINFKLTSFAEIRGEWNFNFRISGSEINKKIKVYKEEKDKLSTSVGEIYLNRIVSTPIKTYVELVGEVNENKLIGSKAFNSLHVSLLNHNGERVNESNHKSSGHMSEDIYVSRHMFDVLDSKYQFDLRGALLKEDIEKINEGETGDIDNKKYTEKISNIYKDVLSKIKNKKVINLSNITNQSLESESFGTIKLKSLGYAKEKHNDLERNTYDNIELDVEISGPMKEALALDGMYLYNKKTNSYSKVMETNGKAVITKDKILSSYEQLNIDDLEIILIDLNEIYDMPKSLNKTIKFNS
ncbi:DUF4179 domain-containing protein [Clostridium sp.]|uniref:DUF4179 domain-containing protein n=1 Tax=Clostridium sp. TaxID=1506 RepID=UPI003463CD34